MRFLKPHLLLVCVVLILAGSSGCRSLTPNLHPPQLQNPLARYGSWGWSGFRRPAETDASRLVPLAPYQPGKIPVVFVHGLLSTPGTWTEMTSALFADPAIASRYQFWVFEYSTGQSYLESAKDLRTELKRVVGLLDPTGQDKALQQMVLVGHSMGGLICKLMVTDSEEKLWNTISNESIQFLDVDEQARQELQELMFFEPLPFVSRVVFIGTPQAGAGDVKTGLGKFGRGLIEFPERVQRQYQELLKRNSGLIKKSALPEIPTSLDHLQPEHPMMQAVHALVPPPHMSLHSLIGTGYNCALGTPGDGFVPLSSAHLDGVESECLISATHTRIHKDEESIREVARILHVHLQCHSHLKPQASFHTLTE